MINELSSFDLFVDDIISSDENLLKGELDFLLMQYIFNSLELDELKDLDSEDQNELYLAAWIMLKHFYDKFWYPIFGGILSKFIFLIEGDNNQKKVKLNKISDKNIK